MLEHSLLADGGFWSYLQHPWSFPTQHNVQNWCQDMDPLTCILLIAGGFVFLFSGFKMHRILLCITGVILGACLGAGLSSRIGIVWVGMVLGILILGVAAWYLTAWSAAAAGAIVGAFLGASVWNMAHLDPGYAWSGALTGAVTLGLLSFIVFRISVILFTSLQGAVMLVVGVLGMAYHYPQIRSAVDHSLGGGPFVLPVTILVLMLVGLGFQYLKGPAGGGKSAGGGAAKPREPEPKKA